MELEIFKANLKAALSSFCEDEKNLFKLKLGEPALSGNLPKHLIPNFVGYDVDPEYNAYEDKAKRVDLNGHASGTLVRPDITIHRRGRRDNLAVFEIKKLGNRDTDGDIRKLKAFTTSEGDYGYAYGLHLIFSPDGSYTIDLYQNGQMTHEKWEI